MSSTEELREEPWRAALARGDPDAAWDLFVEQYRRLIFAAIRHHAGDHDLVMDVFADVCGELRENGLARLRRYWDRPVHRARFSSWLVVVVRHLAIDSLRRQLGRPRRPACAGLSPLQQRIFELLYFERCSQLETYELVRQSLAPALTFRDFARELAVVSRADGAHATATIARELAYPEPLDGDEVPAEELEDPAALLDTRLRIASVLESLEPIERLAVEMFVVDEMPAASIARLVGWPNAKAVYNRVYRALSALRSRLERQGIHRGDL